ncbi:MAG TPA: BON domain-containing protein [Hyphomicrobiales bacterium]|nr:BON domain-containing protein [Hyphomicrobiales bacterium]
MKTMIRIMTAGAVIAGLCSTPVFAEDWQGEAHDAWIDGKLEAAYLFNTELNNFKIGTEVSAGHVTLDGYVPSEAHRQMAEQIASNLEGVTGVTNNLNVGEGDYGWDEKERSFRSSFFDVTTTARLKSTYALNDKLSAVDISVETTNGVVTLTGTVDTPEAKQLAEQIATDYDHVTSVNNQLQVLVASAQ